MILSRILGAALPVVMVLLAAPPAFSHPVPFSYLDLRLGSGAVEAVLTAHVIDIAHDLNVSPAEALLDQAAAEARKGEILSLVRSRLMVAFDGRVLEPRLIRIEPLPDRQALALHLSLDSAAAPGQIEVHCALFPYDPLHQTFLNIYDGPNLLQQEIFTKDRTRYEYFSGSRQGTLAVLRKFIPGGIHHIFTGPDHVLFIIGLILLGGSMLRLLSIVTAFTLAHSITLSLAALNLINLPAWIVEPAIALSIVYVGIDNLLMGREGRDLRAWTAFFFGFVHGFGFAGVLREFGLPPQALGWSLFSFNLGVEIGQACIVVVVALLLAALRNSYPAAGRRVALAGSIVVIAAGGFWFVQRVFFTS